MGADEDDLDETIDETFPASDAPANTVETGVHIAPTPEPDVFDNREARRLELTAEGLTAVLQYERRPHALVLVHTEVPSGIRGRHFGDVLVRAAIAQAQADGLGVVAVCPFVKAYLGKHPNVRATPG